MNRITKDPRIARKIDDAADAMHHMGTVLSKAHTLAEQQLFDEATALESALSRLGVLDLEHALNLAPLDSENVTDDSIRSFLSKLQFRSGHQALEAPLHVDEIRPPLERTIRAFLMLKIAKLGQTTAGICREKLRSVTIEYLKS